MKENFDKFKRSLGLAQIPLIIGLLIMAVAIPVATKLVEQNQDTRNRAAIPLPSPAPNPSTPVPTQGTVTPIPEEQNACRRAGGWCIPTGSSCVNGTTTSSLSCYPPAPGKCCIPITSTNTPAPTKPVSTNTPLPTKTPGLNTPVPTKPATVLTSTPAPTSAPAMTCSWCTNQNQCAASGCAWKGASSYCSVAGDGCCDCGGVGGDDPQPSTISFNGVMLDPNGSNRWTPGTSCSNFKGGSISTTAGSVKWISDEHGGHFDIFNVPKNTQVKVTLIPPGECGLTCDRWAVFTHSNGATVANGNGCEATFTTGDSDWKHGVNFYMKRVVPTATMTPIPTAVPNLTWTINSKVVCPAGRTLTKDVHVFNAKWPPNPLVWNFDTGNSGTFTGEANRSVTISSNNVSNSVYLGMEANYKVSKNLSTGSTIVDYIELKPKGTSPHSSMIFGRYFNPYTHMVRWDRTLPQGTYTIEFEPQEAHMDIVCPTQSTPPSPTAVSPRPTVILSGIPTKTLTICDKAVEIGLGGWKQQYVSNRGRRVQGTWTADINKDGFVDIIDRSIILGCLITNNVM